MDPYQLNQNVNDLTRETTHLVEGKYRKADSLLDQLREAIYSSTRGAGGASQKNTLPLNADALDLLNEITATATEFCALFTQNTAVTGTLEERIQTWAANTQAHRDEAGQTAERITGSWARRIKGLFNPRHIRPLQEACPHCGTRRTTLNVDGENHTSWALNVDVTGPMSDWVATCSHCSTTWEATAISSLLASLDYS